MKKAVSTVLQLVLFLLVFFVGSMVAPFHLEHVLIATPDTTRIFVADGLLLMFVLYLLIVLVQVFRKRLRSSTPWTSLAFVFAIVFGLMMKFGFLTRPTF